MRLQPLDVVICTLVASRAGWRLSYQTLAARLEISPSQAFNSADRANRARLLVRIRRERGTILEPIMENIVEFLVHGVRYAFPPEQGPVTRGVKTLHGAPIVSDRLLSESAPPVWPSPEGGARGDSLEPLHRSVPSLASDPRTHA